jgi:hypothetical protein
LTITCVRLGYAQQCEDADIIAGKGLVLPPTPSDVEAAQGKVQTKPDYAEAAQRLAQAIPRFEKLPDCSTEVAQAYVYLGFSYQALPYARSNETRSSISGPLLDDLKDKAARLAFQLALMSDAEAAISTARMFEKYRRFDPPIQALFDEVRLSIEKETTLRRKAVEEARQAALSDLQLLQSRLIEAQEELARVRSPKPVPAWAAYAGLATGVAILEPFEPFSKRDRREGLMPLLPYISVARRWGQVAVGGLVAVPAPGSHMGGGVIVALALRPARNAPLTLFIGDRIPTDGGPNRMALGLGVDLRF